LLAEDDPSVEEIAWHDYDGYVRAEWAMLSRDPARFAAARQSVEGFSIGRVLDIGCGAGQQLRPFVREGRAVGIGIDASPETGIAGRQLFARDEPLARVAFVRGAAERLPFGTATFDLVVCRLVLPYTDNKLALAEMARVLRPHGALLLKFHHARFYTMELGQALSRGQIKPAIHACRVLFAGGIYHLTDLQPRGRVAGGETFQTMWLLRRELRRHGLEIRRMLTDSVPAAPNLLITRANRSPSGAAAAPTASQLPHQSAGG
jgi:ubiquinone/menaquinone biosynthesis C-methylase UbiE